MKQLLLVCIAIFLSFLANSQNWRCLQITGETYYHNYYLRGISIDSFKVAGTDTLLYPFRSARGFNTPPAYTGSWLGKEVIVKADGVSVFDTYWGDSVFVNTRADFGESWLFYNDTSNRYYIATITDVDTMTLLNTLDSTKEITLTAYAGSNVNAADLIHNRTITISKHHGLVDVFSLYMFPFHSPGTTNYVPGIDWLMDNRDVTSGVIRSYHLIADPDPTEIELYDYDAGDVFQCFEDSIYGGAAEMWSYRVDSILSKTVVSASQVTYQIRRVGSNQKVSPILFPPIFYDSTFLFTVTSSSSDLISMPEKENSRWSYIYKPEDSSHCFVSEAYTMEEDLYSNSPFGSWAEYKKYKKGFGKVHYSNYSGQINPQSLHTYLFYSYKNGQPCGKYFPLAINAVISDSKDSLNVYPNPASSELNITFDGAFSYRLTDMTGKLLKFGVGKNQMKFAVDAFPPGVYILSAIEQHTGRRAMSKMMISR